MIQPSLFDERGLAEITHPDYPGERLIACFNPFMKEERERKREVLLQLTEAALAKVAEACERPRKPLEGKAEIGLKAGAVLSRFKMGKYFKVRIGDYSLSCNRNQELIDQEAALDGIYVVRTSVSKALLSSTVTSALSRPWTWRPTRSPWTSTAGLWFTNSVSWTW